MADAGTAGRRDLTVGPIAPTLLAFALPTLGSSALQSLNGSVNAIWVGRVLGEEALAATTNGNLVMFLLMAFVFGFGMAATILIGQAFGQRDIGGARRVMGTALASFVALATTVAGYVSLTGMIAYIYVRDLPLRLRGRELRFLRPDLPLLKIIVTKGLPMGLQMIVISSSALAMLGLVNQHGVQVTAAYGVTQQLWTYVQMPAMALGAAVSAMAAQNIGAGHWDRVAKITRTGVLFSLAMTGALIVILTLADRAVLGLFLGGDSAAMPIARHIQLIATWGFLFFGVGLVLFGTMRANGEVVGPLIIMFIAMYPVRLGFALGTRDWLGLDALWLSFPAGMVATSIMAVALYLQGGWKRRTMSPTMERPDEIECREQAEAAREPGGALSPAG